MAQIRVDIESQDNARQNIQNLRNEIARIGEEIARNNRIAAQAGAEDRDRLRRRNQELRLTRQVLSANRTASSARLAALRAEERATEQVRRETERLRRTRQDVFRNVAFGAAAVTASFGLLGRSLVQAGIEMEGNINGLTALTGSAEAAEERLASLREVIRQPGVSYRAAVQAAVELRAVGLEAGLANRVIQEFGNSLALVGRTDLNETLLGVRQILSRGRVSQEEINQITERSSLLSQVLRDRFGSVLSEDIQAQIDAAGQNIIDGFLTPVIEGLERLDRAPVDSALNSIQNLGNATFELRAALGDILLPTVTSVVQGITRAVEAFNNMDEGVQRAIVTIGAIATGLAATTTAVAGLGFAITAVQRGLALFQAGGTLAGLGSGLAALVSPPVLAGIGILAAGLTPVAIALREIRDSEELARESSSRFAEQLRLTSAAIGDTSSIDARIQGLRDYVQQLEIANRAIQTQLDAPTLTERFFLGSRRGRLREQGDNEERIQTTQRLIGILERFRETGSATAEQIQELNNIINDTLESAELQGHTEAIQTLENAVGVLEDRLRSFSAANSASAEAARESVVETRNYALELVELQDGLRSAQDAFRGIDNLGDLGGAADAVRQAQERVTASALADIDAQIAANQEIVENERSKANEIERAQERITGLQARRRRIELDGEYELTRVTRQEADARTRIEEDAARRILEYERRVADARRQLLRERASELQGALRQVREIEDIDRRSQVGSVFGQLLQQGQSPTVAIENAIDRVNNFQTLTRGLSRSLNSVSVGTSTLGALLNINLVRGFDVAEEGIRRFTRAIEASKFQLETYPIFSDTAIATAGADSTANAIGASLNAQIRAVDNAITSYTETQRTFATRIIESAVDVPTDLVNASIDSIIRIPQRVERELERLNTRKLDRIADVNEEEQLSVEQKEERILEIERDFARRRVRLEEEANRAKIDSFRAVVTNFTAGIAQMIAGQLRLRAVQSATNFLIGGENSTDGGLLGRLFGGAAGAASGAAFLANPLVGLGVAGGGALLSYLLSGSFHDPINDALARASGDRHSALRAASLLGRDSAADLQTNFDRGFVQGTQRRIAQNEGAVSADRPMNITIEIPPLPEEMRQQGAKLIYETTTREIERGVITPRAVG